MNSKKLLFLIIFFPLVTYAGTLNTIISDPITNVFLTINIFLTIFFVFIRFDRFAVAHGPEVLTTVGILGCFVGIAASLLHFDAANVSESVPHLLEGVKTAFLASLSGVGGSLVIRARYYFQRQPIQQTSGTPKAASLDDLVAATQLLQRSLSGSEDGSLLSQLKLMRQEQVDELRSLRTSFETFSHKMSEDGSKALIEALKEVIHDFNVQINDQFGENFKFLNLSVEKLVIWQQQYKEELDNLQVLQRSSAEDLYKSTSGLALFIDRASNFSKTAEKLDVTLTNMAMQQKEIEQSQLSLSQVLIQMKEVTPQFSSKIDEMMESMSIGVMKIQSEISNIVNNFSAQVQSSSSEMKDLLTNILRKSQTEFNEELNNSMDAVRQSVIILDKGLQEELTKSLETLGRQLASLSEKFVSDYTPLTERLREIIQIASRK